jgi:formate dehydrogenase iron-sulfur subunit
MKAAILTDLTRCVGCEACVWACKEINNLPKDDAAGLSATTWTAIETRNGVSIRRQCMHCLEPTCVSVCPVGALQKTPEGPVIYDESRCIGCRYCMIGCPFGIPKYEWDNPLPKVQKCILCFENCIKKGEQPACTAACPTGATKFGDRDELIHEAQHRILDEPDRYVNHIYGVKEAGGTSVLYLSGVPFEELGFKMDVEGKSYPNLTWSVLSELPTVVSVGGVMLLGFWWLTRRKEVLERVRRGELTMEEARKQEPHLFGGDR